MAGSVISGVSLHLATTAADSDRTISHVRSLIYDVNCSRNITALLNEVDSIPSSEAREELGSVFSINAETTLAGILATARSYFIIFGSPSVAKAVSATSFALSDVIAGRPQSIYIVIPPYRLESHRALLRLWIGALLTLVTFRQRRPDIPTLFIVDEAAQLGTLKPLLSALTLLRGYGVRTCTFWQDLSQVKELYQHSWRTIVNNCDVIRMFGCKSFMAAEDVAAVTGVSPEEILRTPLSDGIVIQGAATALRMRRLDYLRDPQFANLYDANPLYSQ